VIKLEVRMKRFEIRIPNAEVQDSGYYEVEGFFFGFGSGSSLTVILTSSLSQSLSSRFSIRKLGFAPS
jgi:hypothetical protein